MRIPASITAGCVVALGLLACNSGPTSSSANPSSSDSAKASIAGFAFVDSSVAGQGAGAKLPAGAKIYPSGSQLTGTEGCPTNQYKTDGQPMAVIDYSGRPTAASVTVTRHPATGGAFTDAPYYLDLNSGRTLQNLGPIFDNGTYEVRFSYNFNQGAQKTLSASFVLARNCS
ncbi:MAG TPA: hypothetical protein VIH76_13800 [Candidatus Acidoferrales bacterium]